MTVSADDHVKRRHEASDLGGAAARMMRALARRAAEGDTEALEELHALQVVARGELATAVTRYREAGYSWGDIARTLGMSRQAAQQRWGQP